MTIHIDELVVRTILDEGGGGSSTGPSSSDSKIKKEQLIEECVERILEILREREEP